MSKCHKYIYWEYAKRKVFFNYFSKKEIYMKTFGYVKIYSYICETNKNIQLVYMEKNTQKEPAVQYCEETYPQTCEEFKTILDEMYITFCKKQRNYGPGNISVGTTLETKDDVRLALTGLWFRQNDKINRLKQLVVLGQPDEVGESIQDTYEDLSVYGIIAQLVQRGKWGK